MKQLNKYFVFSDVHGEYDALMESLELAGYNPNDETHKLVSLGDNFDRGPKSKPIFRFLRDSKAICVKGNHDAMFQEYLEKGMDGEFVLFNILHNGLAETISSFSGVLDRQFTPQILQHARNNVDRNVLPWIQKMPLYFETDSFIFCHAGIDPDNPCWNLTDEHHILWDIENSHRPCRNTDGKIVVIGHHHAFRVRQNAIDHGFPAMSLKGAQYTTKSPDENGNHPRRRFNWFGNEDEHAPVLIENKIAIDGCTNLTHKVNVLVIEDYAKGDEPEVEEPKIEVTPDGGIGVRVNDELYTYAAYPNFGDMTVGWEQVHNMYYDTVQATTTRG